MKKWHNMNVDDVLVSLGSNAKQGLTPQDIQESQEKYGKNEYEAQKKQSIGMAILYQLKDISTVVLIVAAVLSYILAFKGGSFIEPIVISSIIIMNIALAISQERSAERALEALANLNSPTCIVLRDGAQHEIRTADVVPGDIIVLKPGSLIPADARLIESNSLAVDESALTGESEASEKNANEICDAAAGIADWHNMVFSGCLVTAGNGKAVVTQTGMNTQMGKIAAYLKDTKKLKTPLQKRLDSIGKIVSIVAIIAGILLFIIGMAGGEDILSMMLLAVSMAVAAVPETLSLIVTLTLTRGVQNMVKKNSLIRKLPAVETLGNTSVICSDKTGTLTQNRMSVQRIFVRGKTPINTTDKISDEEMKLLKMFAKASAATAELDADGNLTIIGDPTEKAILRLLFDKTGDNTEPAPEYEKVAEIPFSSDRKMMSVVVKDPKGGYIVLTKGAYDRLQLNKMSEADEKSVIHAHDLFANQAMRVLALAQKKIDFLPDESQLDNLEKDMDFLGFVGLIDPPRPEATKSIQTAKEAGIRTIMITGDHAATAGAIATEIGILEEGQKVCTGAELAEISDEELCDKVQDYSVYARVSPEDKIRIVKAWQSGGEVVAMTGDGVNDAPALKAADVGVAMGKNGTEVAKSASDMVLTDDKFSTIVDAVEEGRNVYLNIQKTVYFLLVCNFSELIVMLFAQLAGWGILATPVMLLLVNVLGDGIPGLQLAKEPAHSEIMGKKPVKRESGFFTSGLLGATIRQTIACSAAILAGFYIGQFVSVSPSFTPIAGIGQTMAFLILGWTSMFHIFNVRSRNSLFKTPYKENKKLVNSALAMVVVFALFGLLPPFQYLFGLTPMSGVHWIITLALSLFPTLVSEIFKFFANKKLEKNSDGVQEVNNFV